MKIYTWTALKALVKDQGYKMAALQNQQGEKIVPFNVYKKSASNLDSQFALMQTRLKSEQHANGVYFVLMSYNIRAAANPHSFAITKGKVDPDQIEASKPDGKQNVQILMNSEKALDYKTAIAMNREIADLTAQLEIVKAENLRLKKEIEEMESEADEGLGEAPVVENGTMKFLSDMVPTIMPVLDRYFDLETRKLDLQQLSQSKAKSRPKGAPVKKEIVPGTQDHLNVIEFYYKNGNEPKLNQELDKLQEINEDLYNQVLVKLGMSDQEEEEEGEEEEPEGEEEHGGD